MSSANKKQQAVINSISGINVVDAGAGTGKTYTITKRYLNILETTKCELDDILLVTFTRNAAFNLKEKVISSVDSSLKDKVIEAPICSFDSYCSKLVTSYGLNAPKYLGLEVGLSSYKLVTEDVILKRIFSNFFNNFLKDNEDKFSELLTVVNNSNSILKLIEELLAKGVYPTKTGWFLDGGNKVLGNYDLFYDRISKLNVPNKGARGDLDSDLLKFFNSNLKSKQYFKENLTDDISSGKSLNEDLFDIAFSDSMVSKLEEFVHLVYLSYIEFMAKENYMTFSLNAMYAFLILYFDNSAREANSFEYVMVDEFQDTNEMQFMLILLLLKSDNLCVVGDWKQGIYGFRNASISNITHFKDKFSHFCDLLNSDGVSRVNFSFDNLDIFNLDFETNYRSSQKILDFSNIALTLPGSSTEKEVDLNGSKVVELQSGNAEYDKFSNIEFIKSSSYEDEIDSILDKINSIVGKKEIYDSKYGGSRFVKFSDIAILSRTRTFGLDILKRAQTVGCPAVYDGGIYLFLEEPSILLLAWLKLMLNKNCKNSWITILEKENLPYLEIERIIFQKDYPEKLLEYRNHLLNNRKVISYVVDDIFKSYGFNNSISNSIVLVLDNLFNSTLMSISDLVIFIEQNIENKSTFNVEISNSLDSVKIQTVHGSKGLEYPIVFVVNCNVRNFPSSIPNTDRIFYDPSCGLRCKKEFSVDKEYVFDSWKSDLMSYKLFSDLDEERRLMYVAITRSMFDVYFTAYNPSTFFTNLALDYEISCPDKFNLDFKNVVDVCDDVDLSISSSISSLKSKVLSVHSLMNFNETSIGRGMKFGNDIHNLAFRYIKGLEINNIYSNLKSDFNNIKSYVDSLRDCEKFVEKDCILKLSNDISVRGIIDAVFVYSDKVVCIDWKSDLDKLNINEYRKQLSIYYYILSEHFNLPVECSIFWTSSGEISKVDILSKEELLKLV